MTPAALDGPHLGLGHRFSELGGGYALGTVAAGLLADAFGIHGAFAAIAGVTALSGGDVAAVVAARAATERCPTLPEDQRHHAQCRDRIGPPPAE